MLLRKGMKISHLRLLAALGDSGQIGAAAQAMGISQPAASRLIAEIERIAGSPLHRRTGRGVALTAAGAALARRAARVLVEIEDAGRELAEIAGGTAGQVRLGAVTGPAMDRVLPALAEARTALPGVEVEVVVGTSDLLCDQVLTGRLDFALARLSMQAPPGALRLRVVAPEPVALVARRDHPLAGGPVTAQDLLAQDWVMPAQDAILRRTVVARLAALGQPEPRVPVATASFLLTLAILQQSDAIAPIAQAVAARHASGPAAPLALLPVDLGIAVEPWGLVTRTDADLTPAARRLCDLVLGAGGAQPSTS